MRNSADAVVIGGGIIGVSVAFYLAREKFGKVILVEKETLLGTGATCKAAGGIRAQFSDETNVRMSMLSEDVFARFKEETGHDALFDQVGYLFLLEEETAIKRFKASYEIQKSVGLNVHLLEPSEIAKCAPHVSLNGIKLGTFCPNDGLGDPAEFLTGYEKAARSLGVEIEIETEVTGLEIKSGKIIGVKTNKGDIATGPLEWIKPEFPMVVDVKSGLYCHKESKGMLLGWADPSVLESTDISVDPDYTDSILERALDRIPQLEEAEVANQWAGLYEVTPDHRSIIGPNPEVGGLFHVTGFSGHGFMHAPAAGIVSAQMLTGQKPQINISTLSPDRFSQGDVSIETNVI